ncbi:MAG TPA: hypothetical protein VGL53_16355 [Bryobacteraceae bacterium]
MQMSWGATIGIGFLTGLIGACAAGYLTYLCIVWLDLSRNDGGDLGYYIVFIPAGMIAGFVIGAVASRFVPGFWAAQGLSTAIVLGICIAIGFVARSYGEVAPEIDGDTLVLDVELKIPRGWQPDNKAKSDRGSNCWLQPMGPGMRLGRMVSGGVSLKNDDGQWIASCGVRLFTSRENRYVRVILGTKTDVTFLLRLPPKPGVAQKQWSDWSNQGFSHETGKPPVTDYFYRARVERVSEVVDAEAAARNARYEAREKAMNALPDNAPIPEWLPFFESADGTPSTFAWGGADRRERRVMTTRVLELGPFLASNDRREKRLAVFALGSLYNTPPLLVEPLAKAGLLTIDLIREARAKALSPDDPDVDAEERVGQFFNLWQNAVTNAGPAEAPKFRDVLEQIEREASPSKTGSIEIIARTVREDLEKLK